MKNSNFKVSIVTPVFNAENYIIDTINSVLNQNYENWEWLITDDCSTDLSYDICQSYAKKDPRINVNRLESNKGAGPARNLSIQLASGDVIAFLDADDLWDSTFLEKSIQFMSENNAAIVYSSYRRLSEDLTVDLGEFIVPEKTNYNRMLKTCVISCLTGMYHIERSGGKVYMPDVRKRQDYCLWLELLKKVEIAHGMTDVTATYRVCASSVSRNKFRAASYQWKVYRNIESLPFYKSLYYFLNYSIYGMIKNYSILKYRSPK